MGMRNIYEMESEEFELDRSERKKRESTSVCASVTWQTGDVSKGWGMGWIVETVCLQR